MEIERYYGPGIRPFGRLSKPTDIKSKKHLNWIREQPCVISGLVGETIVAHHVHRKAQGINDYLTVPLDSTLHDQLHGQGVEYFQGHHLVDLKDAMIAKLVERILELEVGDKRNARRK